MSARLKVIVAMLLFVCGAAAYADPPGRVARLNYSTGAVSFAPGEAPDAWVQAVLNRPLTAGDRLWADQTGRAELHIGSTAMRLGALTSVDVLNLDDDTLQVRLAQGSMNLRVRDLGQGETVEIATPAGAVLVRQPGSYRVTVEPQGDSARVLVNFGQAEVVTPLQTYTVPSSQAATVSASRGASFEVAAYATADELDRWSAERDRREDRVPSTQYVSRDMTGYEDLDQYGTWRTLPDYGAVWVPTQVASGWAPYRTGHWVWVSPWGWTWVDDAPWGFAPFHYGRWVHTGGYWAWSPGAVVRRPVYAPALVAFVGGSNFSVSVTSGPAVGWFPLGWREPYRPWYRASESHVRQVNVTNVTNVTNITNVTNVRYVNRERPDAVTVVSRQAFVSARPVSQAALNVPRTELARAEVVRDRSPAEPVRASIAPERPGYRPPAFAASREVVSVTAPASAATREVPAFRERAGIARTEEAEPRVRVLRRERAETSPAPAAGAPTAVAPASGSGGVGAAAVRAAPAVQPGPARAAADAAAAVAPGAGIGGAGAAAVRAAPAAQPGAPSSAAPPAASAAPAARPPVTAPPPARSADRPGERRDADRRSDTRRDAVERRDERIAPRERQPDSAAAPAAAGVAARPGPTPAARSEASAPRIEAPAPRVQAPAARTEASGPRPDGTGPRPEASGARPEAAPPRTEPGPPRAEPPARRSEAREPPRARLEPQAPTVRPDQPALQARRDEPRVRSPAPQGETPRAVPAPPPQHADARPRPAERPPQPAAQPPRADSRPDSRTRTTD
jgi:hypothetical protein